MLDIASPDVGRALPAAIGIDEFKGNTNKEKYQCKPVIIVTHNSALKDMADKVLYIKSGRIEKTVCNEHPIPIEEIEW